MKYILASKSPRRREILEMLGVKFEVITSEEDESSDITDPYKLVEELSLRKGLAVRDALLAEGRDLSDTVIISSDTVVAIDSEIMFDGEPLFGEGISLLRIESPHKHPLWAVRMLEALDPDDRDVSLYRTGVERCQRLS